MLRNTYFPTGWKFGSTVLFSGSPFANAPRMIPQSSICHEIPSLCPASDSERLWSLNVKRTCNMAWYAIPSIGRSLTSRKGIGVVNWVWRKTTKPSSVTLQLLWRLLSPPIHSSKFQFSRCIRFITRCLPADMSQYTLIACGESEVKDK